MQLTILATISVSFFSSETNSTAKNIANPTTPKHMEILKNGKWNPSVHGTSGTFQFLVIRLWIMRKNAHTIDVQRTNARFSGVPNLKYRNLLATPQPMIPIQIKKTFIILFFC